MRVVIFMLLFIASMQAHDLHHSVEQKQAIVVTFSFGPGTDFSYQKYEIFAPKSNVPFAVGRTDKHSRITFLPDSAGVWKVKTMSDDGHGKELEVTVGKEFEIEAYSQTFFEKFQKLFVGIAVIMMLFFLLQYYLKRKNKIEEK